jgi:WD40 repeat protein
MLSHHLIGDPFPDLPFPVSAMAVLPGARIALACGNSVLVLSLTSGREIERFAEREDHVSSLALLPDGRLACGGHDKQIFVHDLKTSTAEVLHCDLKNDGITSLAVLPDGWLASGEYGGLIRLSDVRGHARSRWLNGHVLPVTSLAPLPDGRLASCGEDGTVRTWDLVETWKMPFDTEVSRIELGSTIAATMAKLSDGRLAVGHDRELLLWNTRVGSAPVALASFGDNLTALIALRDDVVLASAEDGAIGLWDTTSRRQVSRIKLDGGLRCAAALDDATVVGIDWAGQLHRFVLQDV